MSFKAVEIIIDANDEDAFGDLLLAHGALSVTSQAGDESEVFEINGQVDDSWLTIKITGLFDQSMQIKILLDKLSAKNGVQFALKNIAEQDWERAWLENFKPIQISSKLWIVPSWHEVIDKKAVNVQIDPGMSFGTGTHESTRLCLACLSELDLVDKTILDYGCGSGVLAISGLMLGASRALATDIEHRSLVATTDNAKINGVDDRLQVALPQALPQSKFDVVIANILATTLLELKETLIGHMHDNTVILLAGILRDQEQTIKNGFPEIVWNVTYDGNWIALTGRP